MVDRDWRHDGHVQSERDNARRYVYSHCRCNRQHRDSAMDGVQRALHGCYCGCGDHNQDAANGERGRAADNMFRRHDCIAWRQHTGRGRYGDVVNSDCGHHRYVQPERDYARRYVHSRDRGYITIHFEMDSI